MCCLWDKVAGGAGVLAVSLMMWAGGCATPPVPSETLGGTNQTGAADSMIEHRLHPNDHISITFSGVSNPPEKFEGQINENGRISLAYIGSIVAENKTASDLEKEIEGKYVPNYFSQLSVNVNAESRFFYVYGEVRSPGRLIHAGQMTVVRAIAAAGGFTDFASKSRVHVIRASGKIEKVDCLKARDNPKLDLPIYPGDKIEVRRRLM